MALPRQLLLARPPLSAPLQQAAAPPPVAPATPLAAPAAVRWSAQARCHVRFDTGKASLVINAKATP
jgi:hypothetical protein